MPNERPEPLEDEPRGDDQPLGAILVTTILLVTILVTWFGMYLLNLVRS